MTDVYADLLREKNTVRSLKSTAEVVQANIYKLSAGPLQ
jgi:hypothetical protein